MKRALGLLLCAVLCICFMSCSNSPDEDKTTENAIDGPAFLYDIPVDNETELSAMNLPEYSRTGLDAFYGIYTDQDQSIYQGDGVINTLNFEEANAEFPVSFFRKNFYYYYSVYKVKEGGYYYTFWAMPEEDKLQFGDAFYIVERRSKSDFRSLHIGQSTYGDVLKIDPNTEVTFGYSCGISSVNLLNNGKLLEIEYENTDRKGDVNMMLIKSISIVNKRQTPFIANILPKDFPDKNATEVAWLWLGVPVIIAAAILFLLLRKRKNRQKHKQ